MEASINQCQAPSLVPSLGRQNVDAPALQDAIGHVDNTICRFTTTIEIWNGYQPSVDDIMHLESQLEIWCKYRRSLAARLRFLQPPLVTLPVELLVEIFSWCISDDDRWAPIHEIPLHFSVPCRRKSSMYILAQVCQQLRDVIRTNSALHAGLFLTIHPEKLNEAETITRLKAYLKSTHRCPISFKIIFRKGPWHWDIFRRLWESPERWGKRATDVNSSFHWVLGEPVVLSRLRELHILCYADGSLRYIAAPNLVFLKDQCLSSASIDFVRRSGCATTLTDLDLEVRNEAMAANAVALMRLTTHVSYLRLFFPFLPRFLAYPSRGYGKIMEALSECTYPGRDNRRFIVLPKLRHLVVNTDQTMYESYTYFAILTDLIDKRSSA
ncbi:hypothetical protein FISHEDRAFT_75516 [Fistulina hepatica ATCC 64428]|uniref:F-box domain-containing protein n=1 Tax=Fistulina hepatica ATCC 64428 TaxID=1128425 RepID=A0A0D7A9H4_9AGAR|nr:hypothetical protein FISHEDRAFT_75516 [Fistulina hepatica ATCC 64428]